jgi:hypothetical protein
MFKYLFALALLVIHPVAAFTVVVLPAGARAATRLFAEYAKMDGESKINLKVGRTLCMRIAHVPIFVERVVIRFSHVLHTYITRLSLHLTAPSSIFAMMKYRCWLMTVDQKKRRQTD